MGIELIKIRAEISVGSMIVKTPYIQSFNVRKSRGQLSSFDASLKVPYSSISGSNSGGLVTIKAGGNGSMNTIFSGILKRSTISPCWEDPGYVILNISGVDILSKLEGKKYTRRCRATTSSWVTINSVTREGLRGGKFESEYATLKTISGDSIKNQDKVKAPAPTPGQDVVTSEAEVTCSIEVTVLVDDTTEATIA